LSTDVTPFSGKPDKNISVWKTVKSESNTSMMSTSVFLSSRESQAGIKAAKLGSRSLGILNLSCQRSKQLIIPDLHLRRLAGGKLILLPTSFS